MTASPTAAIFASIVIAPQASVTTAIVDSSRLNNIVISGLGVSNDANADHTTIESNTSDEVAFIGEQSSASERREIVCDGRAPLVGWRRIDFGSGGLVRRLAWTPP